MTNEFRQYIIKMCYIILMMCLLVSLSSCAYSGEDNDQVTGVRLDYNVSIIKLNGEIVNIHDSILILYYKDYALFKFPYVYFVGNTNTIFRKEVRYTYFIYRLGSAHGFYYDSLNASPYKTSLVDSLLGAKAFTKVKFYDPENDLLIETDEDDGRNFVTEKYIPRNKSDDSYCDTTYLYYTNEMSTIDYSFSKPLDSAKGMKLYKVKLIYNATTAGNYAIEIPRREFVFELKHSTVANPDEMIGLMERVKNVHPTFTSR